MHLYRFIRVGFLTELKNKFKEKNPKHQRANSKNLYWQLLKRKCRLAGINQLAAWELFLREE